MGGLRKGKLIAWLAALAITLVGVAAIVVLLSAWVLPRVVGRSQKARRLTTIVQMRTLMSALDQYQIDKRGRAPSSEQGLGALITQPSGTAEPERWRGPYLDVDEVPRDGWGNPFEYVALNGGREYRLGSLGADGAPGGLGYDADIESWEPDTMARR
jgi:general secretion pathway protein G